jgi:hypothetical protein
MVAMVLAVLVVVAPSASAGKAVDSWIGSDTSGTVGGEFNTPRDVAVRHSTGQIYVADASNHRIQRFDADGNFERAWGANVLGRDERQRVVVDATGGTFTLTFDGATTDPLAFNASSSTVRTALRGLPTIGGVNVDVSGSATSGSTLTFVGALGGTDVVQVTADASGLTGGSSTVTIDTLENGVGGSGADFEICTAAAQCSAGIATGGNAADNLRNGAMNGPQGVAVNQTTGDVYVRDVGNRRVNQYDADGNFLRSWGFAVDATVAGTGFEICPAANRCAQGSSGSGDGQFGSSSQASTGIDIQSLTGDVFVVDPGNRRIQRFQANGTFVSKFGSSAQYTSSNHPRHLAVSEEGVVYSTDGSNQNELERYDLSSAAFLSAVPGSALRATLNNSTTEGLEIDPSSGRLLIARVPGNSSSPDPFAVFEIDDPGAAATIVDDHVLGDFFTGIGSNGIGFNPDNGDLLVASGTGSSAAHRVYIADDDGAPPALMTVLPASDVSQSSANVAGTVDNPGLFSADYELQVSPNGVDWRTVSSGTAAPGDNLTVDGVVSGLRPSTLYRVRLTTQKQFGNPEVPSAELTFLTDAAPPGIQTTSAQEVGATTATVSARINPNSSQTAYHVEWGSGDELSNVTPIPSASIGSGPDHVLVTQPLPGLDPGASYSFRFVAVSAAGSTTGPTMTFTTADGDAAAPSGDRGYELVSPPDKVGGQGVGIWYQGPTSLAHGGMPSRSGERFASLAWKGGVLLDDGAYTFASDWAFGERMGSVLGWQNHSPITHAAGAPHDYVFLNMGAATDDFSRVVWGGSQAPLRIFEEMQTWPATEDHQYIGDWAGRWEIIGPKDRDAVVVPIVGGRTSFTTLSADGSTAAVSTVVRGMSGPDDPTLALPAPAGNNVPANVYAADMSGPPANTLAGTGERVLLNVCTPGTELPAADASQDLSPQACPGGALISQDGATTAVGATTNSNASSSEGVISADGSHVFFMSPDPGSSGIASGIAGAGSNPFCDQPGEGCPPQLYVARRQADGSYLTRWISRSRSEALGAEVYGGPAIAGQDATLTGRVVFEGASSDGDKVLFRTNSPLTPDDPNGGAQVSGGVTTGVASSDSWDLYLYDFPDDAEADPGDGTLTRISAGPTGDGDGNGPQNLDTGAGSVVGQGMLRFASDDASRLYFATSAPLPGVGPPDNGAIGDPGGTPQTTDQTNLYTYDASEDDPSARWRYVTRLPRSTDGPDMCASTGVIRGSPLIVAAGGESINNPGVPSLGRTVANCVSGTPDGEFVTFWTAGRLTADDPDTASADIYAYDHARDELVRVTANQGGVGGSYVCDFATALPCNGDGGMDTRDGGAFPRVPKSALGVVTDPDVPGDRIAFFESRSRLVPQDLDSNYDVYQWRNGELTLISPGSSPSGSGYLYRGNSADGKNVYMATLDRLSWQDVDSVGDNYTARVAGGITQPPPPVLCSALASGCQGAGMAVPLAVQPKTRSSAGSPSGDNVSPGARKTLRVANLSRKARRRAARRGVLPVRVRTSRAGLVRVLARARIGKRTRRVAGRKVRVREAGAVTVKLRLNRAAKRRLRSGRALRVTLRVASAGARTRTATVRLERGSRS